MRSVEEIITHPLFKEGECWQIVRYKSGQKIVTEGDCGVDLYLLKTGCVRVLGSVDVNDTHIIKPGMCDMAAGDIFGELSLFGQQPRSASVVCIEDSEIIVIDGVKLLSFLQLHTDIGFTFMRELMELLVNRLRSSNEKVFSLFAWGLKAHKIDDHLR